YPLLVLSNGNATPIVGDGYRLIWMHDDTYLGAVASQGFVDGVIHDLENHVVQPGAIICIADVHAWPLSDRIQPLEHLDRRGVVGATPCIFLALAWCHFFRHDLFRSWSSICIYPQMVLEC